MDAPSGRKSEEECHDGLATVWTRIQRPEDFAAMRLKLNVPLPEEKCLLRSRHVSPRYEDRLRSYRGLSERKSPPKNFLFRTSPWPQERSTACDMGSPDADSVRAMSLSSSEPEDRDLSDQDEEEFEDTSPLLAAAKANILAGDDYGSGSENSSTASSSDEEESSEDSGLTEMSDGTLLNERIEPNNNFIDSVFLRSADTRFVGGQDDEVTMNFVTAEPVTALMANVLTLNVGSSPTSGDYNDFSPMSEGSTASLASSLTSSSMIGMASMTSSTMSVDLVSNANAFRDVAWTPEDSFVMDKVKKTDANVRERAAVEEYGDLKIVNGGDPFDPEALTPDAEEFSRRSRRKAYRDEGVRLLPDVLPPLKILEECENVLSSAAVTKAEIDQQNASRRKHLLEGGTDKPPSYSVAPDLDASLPEDVSRWALPENVAKIFDKAELTREATTSAASLLNFTPEKVRRSRLSLAPTGPAARHADGRQQASRSAATSSVATAERRRGRASLSPERCGDFDVYNIETSMPTIDWEAMERHLSRAAKEDDWLARRRNDREAIRQKLAMDTDVEESFGIERTNRKPSLAVRLQESKNLQICFMNETAAELDSLELSGEAARPHNDSSTQQATSQQGSANASVGLPNGLLNASSDVSLLQTKPAQCTSPPVRRASHEEAAPKRPSFFFNRRKSWRQKKTDGSGELKKEAKSWNGEDFATRQARLQAEARAALAQAKEMARMQMEVERQQKKKSPIADIVGISFPDSRHRLSRQLLNDMNVAQLQVIVNDLHSQIESHNEDLVKFLLERDDLHMEQDSMLVDIEDMTRYLGAKNMSASRDGSSVSLSHPAKTIP
ncbi:hypothetical protein MRX96_035399 [Rhipicephalus microplus]